MVFSKLIKKIFFIEFFFKEKSIIQNVLFVSTTIDILYFYLFILR